MKYSGKINKNPSYPLDVTGNNELDTVQQEIYEQTKKVIKYFE